MNVRLASGTLSALLALGVTEYCVCPGARNAPWIAALTQNEDRLRCFYFYDERSAAFFALGRIRASGKPVAVVTTSGTAVGELLPGAMEAHYSGLPLVLLTADRPRRFRNSGAPQAAEQAGLFGVYAHASLDLAGADAWPEALEWDRAGALHVNVCFEEPLLNPRDFYSLTELRATESTFQGPQVSERQEQEKVRASEIFTGLRHPLVIVAGLSSSHQAAVRSFLKSVGAPTYFEALSGLREDPGLAGQRIHSGDRLLERASEHGYPVDGILRIGGVPTLRAWRDLEDRFAGLPVVSLSELPFSGLGRTAPCAWGDLSSLLTHFAALSHGPAPVSLEFLAADLKHHRSVTRLLLEEPRSEPGIFRALSEKIPAAARIYLGNSLPIREWDLAATAENRHLTITASRGLNGIDGQVSTFLGLCEKAGSNWGIFGDLTALYDLSGPWALSQLAPEVCANLVVINNGGGKIFDRMFSNPRFQNNHTLQFDSWASLWGLAYCRWEELPTSVEGKQSRIIEIVPDPEATTRFWGRYAAL